MARPYNKLRMLMQELDVTRADMAEAMGISEQSLCFRFTCRQDWKLEEIYIVMEMLHIRTEKMATYFPRRGINEEGTERPNLHGRRKFYVGGN